MASRVWGLLLTNNKRKFATCWGNPLASYCSSVITSDSRQINLDKEKEDRVLNILNGNDKNELMRYPISKTRLDKIQRWKAKNGRIENIEDLLQLDGFGVKMLEKMCENIISHLDKPPLETNASSSKRPGVFTIPAVPTAMRDQYKSCVSVFTTVSSITWARIVLTDNNPCHLSHWQHHEISEKRMHIGDLVRNMLYVIKMIPEADCYVMENPQIAQAAAPGGAEQVNINVQKAQITGLLNYGLMSRANLKLDQSNVFYLKKYLSSRIFNTLVGNERVSTEHVVAELLRTVYNVEDWLENSGNERGTSGDNLTLRSNVNVPMELREVYNNAERYQRDFLGQALLIGMTFIRLCLLRTPESLASVSRNQKDDIDLGG
ncbi:unnamed protein product [Hermetia illucens]|uniref:Transcription elongation factor, mitochondrial n=1 Tax=Hermetia illucens TaxID=343691 RepID=A0A7R8UGY0_HERIL|nr:uncharacterized protein LOC119647622 [Hermetia illucens]CAD7080419.1 unnamed protein product [Hermetia illucens]